MPTAGATTAQYDIDAYRPPTRQRIDSIDLLRGLVMVIMMLDHTRDYFSAAGYHFDPADVTKTSVALFFTRWITHFCAPTFFFLAGTGAYLRGARGATPAYMSWFLASRGIWLIFLEMTVVRIGVTFALPDSFLVGQTIWALGWSMIVLALLAHAPVRVTGAFGVLMILVHNAFDGFHAAHWAPGQPDPGLASKLLLVLHERGLVPLAGPAGPTLLTMYPLIPWIGVMAAGYAFGRLYTMDEQDRRRILTRLGGGLIVLFVLLRATNVYGDASKWSVQPRAAFTILSFLNVTKYPPSLLYLCMTLGPVILLLAFLETSRRGRLGAALVTLGRVPMLFYLLQWYVAHALAIVAFAAAGKPIAAVFSGSGHPIAPELIPLAGFSLPVVYAFWIIGVLLIYPLCTRFAAVKKRRTDWWLGYL